MIKEDNKLLLDPSIIINFRQNINESPIFYMDNNIKKRWNFTCAMMDRVDTAVKYINSNAFKVHQSEESFITYLTYCCILKDAIKELYNQIPFLKEQYNSTLNVFGNDYDKFMREYNRDIPNATINKNLVTDDVFFEFIRSLTFAHPLKTDRAKFLRQGEMLCSPFLLMNDLFNKNKENSIGICIYSNITDQTSHLWFSIDTINKYITSKYAMLSEASVWVKNTIKEFSQIWSNKKIDRKQDDLKILEDIKEILTERYCEHYFIDETINYLKCHVSNSQNYNATVQYINNIKLYIPDVCDWIDSLQDEEKYPEMFFNALDPKPKELHIMCGYQLEKIFSYLNDDTINYQEYIANRNIYIQHCYDNNIGNFDFGLIQAELFFKNFAKDYIFFDLEKIQTATEIKLLVNTALFLEMQNQEKGIVNKSILDSQKEREKNHKNIKVIDSMTIKGTNGEDFTIQFVDASKKKEDK